MKHRILLLTLLSATVLMVGCEKSKTKTAAPEIAKIQAKTTEVAKDLKDYTFAQKAEFTKSMQTDLATINKELDALEAKLANASVAVKAEAKPKIAALRAQSAALTVQLDAIKDSTESTWDSVKAGTKKAYGALKDGFNSARDWVGEKIST